MNRLPPSVLTCGRRFALPWPAGFGIVLAIAGVKLLLHLYAARFYGYFVDELYFIACSRHLAWGYVDQPPLIALIVRVERLLFGDSLQSIRLASALAGVLTVVLTGLIAREFGGRRFAQGIAALAVLTAPISLSMNHYISMNAFEPPLWMGCALVLIRILKGESEKLWLWFGLIAGIGLENKYGIGFFLLGIAAGMVLTDNRRMLARRWVWLGAALAFAVFLPNLVWNAQHHFPFIELMRNVRESGRNVPLTHWQFLQAVAGLMNFANLPLALAGLWLLLFRREDGRFRVLGCAVVVVLTLMMFSGNGRPYYVAPAFPLLFAAGGVAIEDQLLRRGLRWLRPAYIALVLVIGIIGAPLAIPVLPAETYLRYTQFMHMEQPRIETHQLGPLPQFFADMYGWEEMTEVVARAYNALPAEERAKTAIFGGNFGQAGAIDLFGVKYGLPKAIASHQNYYFWGPGRYTGESILVMGARRSELEPFCSSLEAVGEVGHPYSMPYEHFTVYHCRGSKRPLAELWPTLKNWR